MAKKKNGKFYIAYGSNMDVEQMEHRCPGAQLVSTGEISGWEYLFKGSLTGSYATIERKKGAPNIPVYVWEITEYDEERLDRYEGFPRFYYKRNIRVKLHSTQKSAIGMVYIMHEDREPGIPSAEYFNNVREIYNDHNWPDYIIWDALDKSEEYIRREAKKQ